MTTKVQGEGDYESARHYDEQTRQFVDENTQDEQTIEGSAAEATDELTPAEKAARARAKGTEQDKRDAEVLRQAEQQRQG